jgi:uncharacterized protein with von Willebrand factor type A (vWA) domain
VIGFGRELRGEGLSVGTGQIVEFSRAASLLGPGDLYWVGRATLVMRRADIKPYDIVFDRYWKGNYGRRYELKEVIERVRGVADDGELEGGEEGRDVTPDAEKASRLELLRTRSFATLNEAELRELARLVARLSLAVPVRRSRRRQPARRGAPDLRRTLRQSFRTGGEPMHLAWRERRRRPRRVIFILDVSGSMASYSRGLLVFAHAALRTGGNWESFCFGTRLTRVTRALSRSDPDVALARAADEVQDWDGGTRIGDSLKQFLDRYGHGGMARGAIVVICSDGLDIGDPELLAEQMRRLTRLAHRLIWLNPLSEQAGYQPIARGMSAALPFVDTFASGHSWASLEALARELAD